MTTPVGRRHGQPTPAELLALYEHLELPLAPCNGKKPLNEGWRDDCLTTEAAKTHLDNGGAVALV